MIKAILLMGRKRLKNIWLHYPFLFIKALLWTKNFSKIEKFLFSNYNVPNKFLSYQWIKYHTKYHTKSFIISILVQWYTGKSQSGSMKLFKRSLKIEELGKFAI